MLPSVPIFPVYNFFRQNIWHSIFDQFHFHHIFGDEMTVSSDKTGKDTSRPPFGSWHVLFLGTSWMAIREKSFKFLDEQQVSQQISISFKSKFHNEGGDCQKSSFEVFFSQGSHMSPPKISTLTDPPFTFFAQISKIFDKYQMPIFFIEYLGSIQSIRTWLMYIWSKLSKI